MAVVFSLHSSYVRNVGQGGAEVFDPRTETVVVVILELIDDPGEIAAIGCESVTGIAVGLGRLLQAAVVELDWLNDRALQQANGGAGPSHREGLNGTVVFFRRAKFVHEGNGLDRWGARVSQNDGSDVGWWVEVENGMGIVFVVVRVRNSFQYRFKFVECPVCKQVGGTGGSIERALGHASKVCAFLGKVDTTSGFADLDLVAKGLLVWQVEVKGKLEAGVPGGAFPDEVLKIVRTFPNGRLEVSGDQVEYEGYRVQDGALAAAVRADENMELLL